MKIFFDINKNIYKYNNNSLIKINDLNDCDGGICLTINTSTRLEDKNLYTNVFDKDIKTDLIKKELKLELEEYVYQTHIENNKIYVFGITKEYFTHLIDTCGFEKVYPLEFLFLKLGYGKNGIVSNDIMLLKRYESDDDYRSNYLSNTNETVYYIGLSVDIYIKNLERMFGDDVIEANLAVFANEIIEAIPSISSVSIDRFESLLKQYKNFYIIDNISQRYKRQILHKYMALGDIVFLSIIGVFVFLYLKVIAQENIYKSEIEEQTLKITKFEKLSKDILQELPKMDFYKFPLDIARDYLIPFTKYDPSKFTYNFDIPKNKIEINMIVNGISNVENLVGYLKSQKYENTYIKKDGYNFEFKISIKINDNSNIKGKK